MPLFFCIKFAMNRQDIIIIAIKVADECLDLCNMYNFFMLFCENLLTKARFGVKIDTANK